MDPDVGGPKTYRSSGSATLDCHYFNRKMKNILCLFRWGDGKKPDEIKKEGGGEDEKKEEEEEEDEGEPDPNDMSIPVGTKKLMRRCFNPVTGHHHLKLL